MATVNIGRVAYVDRGAFSPTTRYTKMDVVHYANGSFVYINANDSSGILPTDTAYWTAMVDPMRMNDAIENAEDAVENCSQAILNINMEGADLAKNDSKAVAIPLATEVTSGAMTARDKALLDAMGGFADINDWDDIKAIVQSGAGERLFHIGTQLHSEKLKAVSVSTHNDSLSVSVDASTFIQKLGYVSSGEYTIRYLGGVWRYKHASIELAEFGIFVTGQAVENDAITMIVASDVFAWDVVHHGLVRDVVTGDDKPGMVLLLHNANDLVQFDAQEALYYVSETVWPDGMPPGTYNFTSTGSNTTRDSAGTFAFTTTKTLPADGHIVLTWRYYQPITAGSIKTYISGSSTAALETITPVEGVVTDGTHLGTTGDVTSYMNDIDRARNGSDNYAESAARQWLNSSEDTSWQPQTMFDRRPAHANLPGFLKGMDAKFLDAVGITNLQCESNHIFEVNPEMPLPYSYHVQDKFFIPSGYEIGEWTSDQYDQWTAYINAPANDRVKYDKNNAAPCIWWLRDQWGTGTGTVIYTNGMLITINIYARLAVVPACVIY